MRKKRKYSKRAARYISRAISKEWHKGVKRSKVIAIGLSKARRRGFKIPHKRRKR